MSPLLLAPLQAATDTVYVTAPPSTLQVATDISVILMAVVSTFVLLAVALFLFQVRKFLATVPTEIRQVARRSKGTAENVEYISTVVREDIHRVHEVIGGLSERLNDASDRMEDRVREFNALMEVVQGEAERVFIDTASVVRGMQAGAAHVGRRDRPPDGEETDPLPAEPDPR